MADRNDKKNVSGAQFAQPSEEFAVRSATSRFQFRTEDVQPPGYCYVGVDDQLELTQVLLVNNNNVICNVRILRDDGEIIPLVFALTAGAAGAVTQQRFQLVEGYLLSCSLVASFGLNTGNILWASAALIRPPNTALAQYELLASGYPSNNTPIGFPNSVPQRPTDGPGQPRSVTITTPGAGADFLFTIPTSARMRIVSLNAVLTTSAAVANRDVSLVIDDGANVVAELNSGANQLASLTQEYTWGDSLPLASVFNGNQMIPLPSQLILPPAFRIRSETTAIDVADQWSSIFMLVHEWVDIG